MCNLGTDIQYICPGDIGVLLNSDDSHGHGQASSATTPNRHFNLALISKGPIKQSSPQKWHKMRNKQNTVLWRAKISQHVHHNSVSPKNLHTPTGKMSRWHLKMLRSGLPTLFTLVHKIVVPSNLRNCYDFDLTWPIRPVSFRWVIYNKQKQTWLKIRH